MINLRISKFDLEYKKIADNSIKYKDIVITFTESIGEIHLTKEFLEDDYWYILPIGIKSIHNVKSEVKHGQEIIFDPVSYRVLKNTLWHEGKETKTLYELNEKKDTKQEKSYLLFSKCQKPSFDNFEVLIDITQSRGDETRIEKGELIEILNYAPGNWVRHIYSL